MDATLKALLDSGKKLLTDTKMPRKAAAAKPGKKMGVIEEVGETDPFRIFSKRVIAEKPKRADVLKEIRRFIESAEAAL